MKSTGTFLRQHAARIFALATVIISYGFVQLPSLPEQERSELASHFQFTRHPLPGVQSETQQLVRRVHPSLEHISAWISSVGGAVALWDLDGDGFSNDICYVDTRTDQVIVTPSPGQTVRYDPFALAFDHNGYDATTIAPMGCVPGDFNEDGRADILVYFWGRTPLVLLQDPSCDSSQAKLAQSCWIQHDIVSDRSRWYTNAATQADLDGDGHIDLIFGNYFADGARILDPTADGSERMQHSMSRAFNGGRNRIFRWVGASVDSAPTVSFEDVSDVLTHDVAHGWTLAVGATDLDGDLLPEIYIAHDFGPDRLLHNRSTAGQIVLVPTTGTETISSPSSKVVGRDSFKGMGVEFCDLNRDGHSDILVSNIASEYSLEESHFAFISTGDTEQFKNQVAPYVDQSEQLGLSRSGWAWDIKTGDFDADGVLEVIQATGFAKGDANRWPELHELAMGNDDVLSNPKSWPRFQLGDELSGNQHNPFFVRGSDNRYYDIASEIAIDEPYVTRGLAVADVDGDGDLDFATGNQFDDSHAYINEAQSQSTFLGLRLVVPVGPNSTTNVLAIRGLSRSEVPVRPAIGARVQVYLPNNAALVQHVDGGSGHSGVCSPDLFFGLGGSTDDVRIDISWRDGNGLARKESLTLAPGWHTVLLGQSSVAGGESL